MHFAALSHVDRSIKTPVSLVSENINSTYSLGYFCALNNIPFINIGTDEIFGELKNNDMAFNDNSPLLPRNPYSASKAASEILLESLTKQFPNWKIIFTRCVNNFGEYQDFSKLIPTCVDCILNNKLIPVYGFGNQIRSWIDVKIHNRVILELIEKSINNSYNINLGCSRKYCIGSQYEFENIQLIEMICNLMDVKDFLNHVEFISDPRGNAHDFRYSLDYRKTEQFLNHHIDFDFTQRLKDTIEFYKKYLNDKENYWKSSK